MERLTIIWIVVCIYLSVLLAIGVYYKKFAEKSSLDFLVAGRNLGPNTAKT